MSAPPFLDPRGKIARDFGFEPIGPRRSMFWNQEATFTATLQGANLHFKLTRSIFVDYLVVNMAMRPFGAAPAAATIPEVLGLIAWAETDPGKADLGATQYYPIGLTKADPTFLDYVTSGNSASNAGTQHAQNFLWGHIIKGYMPISQQMTGVLETHNTLLPYQYIPEAATLTSHMDEDMTGGACNLDAEIVATLYYTPVKTVKVFR